jgi:AraC family transcriptional regulator of arabinose operon
MSFKVHFMSDSVLKRVNVGAYDQPYSGVGIEYYPLGGEFDHTGLLIHEVGFLPFNKNWNFPSVFSSFWRLYYNFKPGHCVSFPDQFYEITPEHIMLIPDHQLFHCLGANPVPTFWMAFSINHSVSPIQPVPILLKPTKTELSLIRDIQKLIVKDTTYEPTDAIYRNSLALLNVVMANSNIQWKKDRPVILNELLRYIEKNSSQKLPNSHLAEVACMSIEGLSKMFRNHIGTSPAAYVTQIRVKQASRLLLHSNETIERIAMTTGFPNRNYFSRVFKQIANESPAKFQRLHRDIKQ